MADIGLKPKRRGRTKWIALVGFALAIAIAAETGWLGFGWALVRAATFPSDDALLAYVPGDVTAVVIVDPHQLELAALGSGQGPLRSAVERVRADVKKVTEIDLVYDVDKLVLSTGLVVARGRFRTEKIATQLVDAHYVKSVDASTVTLIRPDEDAFVFIDDSILLYGDEASVKAALDAKESGKSLKQEEHVIDRLAALGWNHAILATVRLADDKPSLREALSGASGPRAVSIGIGAKKGLDLAVQIETGSPKAAGDLKTSIDEKRTKADALSGALGADLAPAVVEAAKAANIGLDPSGSAVTIKVHLEPSGVDALMQAAMKAGVPALEKYKELKIVKLFMP